MRKDIIFGVFLLVVVILSACDKIDVSKLSDKDLQRISKELIICNPPYIRHASDCCLDKNNNAICDNDEQIGQKLKTEQKATETPSGIESPIQETPAEPTHPETPVGKETEKVEGMCKFPDGIKCIDFKVNSVTNTIILKLENSFGNDIPDYQVVVTGCNRTTWWGNWQINEVKIFVQTRCDPLLFNLPVYNGDINVSYRRVNQGDIQKVQGTLVTKIERKNVEEKCTLEGTKCVDYKITPTNIQVRLLNGLGMDINSVVVEAENCENSGAGISLANGDSNTFTITCSPTLTGSQYDGQLTVSYTNTDTGVSHTNVGVGRLTGSIGS